MVKMHKQPDFNYQNYEKQQDKFVEETKNYNKVHNELISYIEKVKTLENPKKYKKNIYKILPKKDIDCDYNVSSDNQIRKMAQKVYKLAIDETNNKNLKMYDTVYATDSKTAAYTNSPQSYLFLVVDKKQNQMVAYVAIPNKNDVQIRRVMDLEKSKNVKYVQNEIARLLLIYSNKVF